MAKTYKIWLEIEEYDDETDEYTDMTDALPFSSTVECNTLEEAIKKATSMHTAEGNVLVDEGYGSRRGEEQS